MSMKRTCAISSSISFFAPVGIGNHCRRGSLTPLPHSFGAADWASFWKRGSFRSESNIGSSRSSAGVNGGSCPKVLGLLFRRQRGDDFFEARIAAERVPDREQFQGAVAQHERCGGGTQSSFQLLQGKLLLACPRCRDREILKDQNAVVDIFFHRRECDRPTEKDV